MRMIRWIALVVAWLACLTSTGCTATPVIKAGAGELGGLAWMSGTWMGESGSTITEEHWTLPAGGTMFGVNRTIREGKTIFFEYLRIERQAEETFYMASPKGRQPPTPFKMVEHIPTNSGGRAVFENPQHDFPQRIVYQREGDVMKAQIEGMRNGRIAAEGWKWRLVK